MSPWVQEMYDAHGKFLEKLSKNPKLEWSDEALMILFRGIDNLLCEGKFEQVNQDLQDIDLEKLDSTLLVGLLSITFAAKKHLPYREPMTLKLAERLKVLVPDKWERLIKNRC